MKQKEKVQVTSQSLKLKTTSRHLPTIERLSYGDSLLDREILEFFMPEVKSRGSNTLHKFKEKSNSQDKLPKSFDFKQQFGGRYHIQNNLRRSQPRINGIDQYTLKNQQEIKTQGVNSKFQQLYNLLKVEPVDFQNQTIAKRMKQDRKLSSTKILLKPKRTLYFEDSQERMKNSEEALLSKKNSTMDPVTKVNFYNQISLNQRVQSQSLYLQNRVLKIQ